MRKALVCIMTNTIALLAALLLSISSYAAGDKILFFFGGGTYSHKVSVWPIVTALADKGHDITFVSSFRKKPKEHHRIRDIVPEFMEKAMGRHFQDRDRLTDRLKGVEAELFANYHSDIIKLCRGTLNAVKTDSDLMNLFFSEKFDLIINNAILGDCGYVLAHKLMSDGAKLIVFDSTYLVAWWTDLWGYPAETSWIPEGGAIGNFPMTFLDRLWNLFQPLYWHLCRVWSLHPQISKMGTELYGLSEPMDVTEVEKSASLVLVASDFTRDFARSIPPFVVHVGGMQCWENKKPLEKEYQEILDKAVDGAVLIAFGSTVNLAKAPPKLKQMFLEATRSYPDVKFIWRWPGSPPENYSANNYFAPWLPQFEILGHPNIKTFISHAGLNSVTEATFHGVPPILLPLFADQDYNAYRLQAYETGIRLEVRGLTQEKLEAALREIFTNDRYRKNMQQTSKIMRDRQLSPVELAVYWTEFVLRHENISSLKPLGHLTWFQRKYIDAFLLLSFITALLIITMCSCCRRKMSYPYETSNSKKSN